MTPPMTPREKVRQIIEDAMNSAIPELWEVANHATDRVLTALASGSGDHAELARLAEAATPGPWFETGTTVWREEAVPIPVTVCCGNGLPSGECCGNGVEDCEWDRTQGEIANAGSNDAAFIAAANPATVLALLAENAALRAERDGWKSWSKDWKALTELNGKRATEAERGLAGAVGLLREAIEPYEHISNVRAFEVMENGPATRLVTIRAFLSKEAERG